MTTDAPRWSRLEYDDRRAQILDCARRLFSERGYDAVSFTDIARELGVTRALLHHYFRHKRDLYLEVVHLMAELGPPLIRTDLRGLPVEQMVAANVDAWLDSVEQDRETYLAAIGVGGSRDPDVDAIMERAREAAVDRIVLNHTGQTEAPPELRFMLRGYIGLVEAAVREWLARERADRAQVHTLVTRTLVAMMRDVAPALSGSREPRRAAEA